MMHTRDVVNETPHNHSASDVPWLTSDRRKHAPDSSMLHSGAPVAAQLADGVSAAEKTAQEEAEHLRGTGNAWVDSMRATVRGNPLACLAAAVATGAVIARMARMARSPSAAR